MATPIVQEFEANFSGFNVAVQQADDQLKSFTVDSEKVEKQLGRMTDSFSGAKVIQQATLMADAIERVGGVSVLTEQELARVGAVAQEAMAKAEALGMEAPASVQALAAATQGAEAEMSALGGTVQEVGGMIAEYFVAEKIIEFGASAVEAGANIEKMSEQTDMSVNEVQRLNYIAGQTDTSVDGLVSAVQNLTLKIGKGDAGATGALAELGINMKQFMDADPYQRLVQISAGFANIESATDQARIGNELFGKAWKANMPAIKSDMDAIGDRAVVMSDKSVKGLAEMTHAGSALWTGIKSVAGEFIADAADMTTSIIDFETTGSTHLEAATTRQTAAIHNETQAFNDLTIAADAVKNAEKEMDKLFQQTIDKSKTAANEAKKAAAEQQRQAEEFYKAIDKIREKYSGEQAVKDAQQYVQAFNTIGDAVNTLTTKELNDFETKLQEGITGLSRTGQLTSETADQFVAAIAKIEQLKAAQVDTAAAAAAAAQQAAEAERAWTQSMYDAAVAADAEAQATQKATDEKKKAAQAAQDAADAKAKAGGVYNAAGLPTADSLTRAAMVPGSMLGWSTGQMVQSGGDVAAADYAWIQRLVGRASGGAVSAGTPYVVGERGPELFVPSSSGAIVPNGAGSTVVNNTFHLVDTASNLARQVSDILARQVTQARRV